MLKLLENCESFQWDEGNSEKNWISHKVTRSESEQVFFNKPVILSNLKISKKEKRWYLLGKTDQDRKLFTVFTIRDTSIRIISARDMSKKEKELYDEEIKKNTSI